MTVNLTEITTFQDALELKDHGLPYALDKIFSHDKKTSRSIQKRKFQILRQFDGQLRKMLEPGEVVLNLSYGIENSIFDHLFLGYVMQILNRRVFLFTNRRILLLQFGAKFKPAELKTQIQYYNIDKVKKSGLGNTVIYLRNKEKKLFTGMPKLDRKKFIETIDFLKSKIDMLPEFNGGIENLCPHCYQIVNGNPKMCPQCNGKLKSPRLAGLLSFLFPGFGDMYLGHRGFALLEIIGAGVLWANIFMPEKNVQPTTASIAVSAVFLFLFMHGLDAFVTSRVAKKGLYPA